MTLRSEKNSNFDSNISEKSSRIRKFCSVNEIEKKISEAFVRILFNVFCGLRIVSTVKDGRGQSLKGHENSLVIILMGRL